MPPSLRSSLKALAVVVNFRVALSVRLSRGMGLAALEFIFISTMQLDPDHWAALHFDSATWSVVYQ